MRIYSQAYTLSNVDKPKALHLLKFTSTTIRVNGMARRLKGIYVHLRKCDEGLAKVGLSFQALNTVHISRHVTVRLLTTESQICSQGSPCEICGREVTLVDLLLPEFWYTLYNTIS